MKRNTIYNIILILLTAVILSFFTIKVYAAESQTLDEQDEETLVRMSTSLSKGKQANNNVNTSTFTNFLNKYAGEGETQVQENGENLLQIVFNKTGNSYTINLISGFLDWIQNLSYIITYDANGGSMIPYVQMAKQGEATMLTNFMPTRPGYTFLGWSTSSAATTPQYGPRDGFTGNTNTILFAVWGTTSPNEYTILYSTNGGLGAPIAHTVVIGGSTNLSTIVPTRNEHTFLGWSTTPYALMPEYQPGDQITPTKNIILYAVWRGDTEYSITFNANGGEDEPTEMIAEKNVAVTLPTTRPTRNGYTFIGWNTSSTATTALYLPGGTYSGNKDVILYAIWAINYTITFDSDGGSGGPTTLEYVSGQEVTIPIEQPTKNGFVFIGWNSSRGAATAEYLPGNNYSITGNKTVYAVWSSNTWTITYNANGGTFGATTTTTTNVTKGQSTTIISTTPTRANSASSSYTFLGWAESQSATTETYTAGRSITPTADMILWAVWKEEPLVTTYTITFNANSGSGAPSAITVNQGEPALIPDNVPTRTGSWVTTYTFVGWSTTNKTASSDVTADYAPGELIPASEITDDMILYATYHSQSSMSGTRYYVVLFNQKGGSNGPIALRVRQGQAGTIPTTVPTRDGYTFLGWSTDANAATVTYAAGASITPTANTTLYAVWQAP